MTTTSSRTRLFPLRLPRFLRVPSLTIAVLVLVIMMSVALFAPLPHNPIRADGALPLLPPGPEFWFGTDVYGFDVFSRTVAAAGRDLPLAIAGAVLSLVIGVPLGLAASGKSRFSTRLMQALDVFQSFPLVIICIAIVTLTGNHLGNVIFAILVINVPRFMRLIRSEALSLRESRFIEAAHAIGASRPRVLFRHMLPNVWPIALAQVSLAASHAIVVIAALSFLGIGISPPEPSWGAMIQSGAALMTTGQWWVVAFPGLAIFIAVLSLNAIADGIQSLMADASERKE